jgi:primosomal protein N' (replication factor Y)
VILGSATPSLESYQNALSGKYILSVLKKRATAASLPVVTICDMRKEYEKNKGFTLFSEMLLNGIEKRLKKGEQTLLFLNRRGYHSMLFCKACEAPLGCPHCSTALTFHFSEKILCCHLCLYQIPLQRECPKCRHPDPMIFKGVGTEQVERSLHALFKEIRTIRLDADTTKHKGSQQKLLRDFGSGKADVLIGTQMIAKGLHFSEVTLVGVLNTDQALNIPDFRSSEVVFQLITQVAGRAGRGDLPGEVIIQTAMPNNETIQCAASQDFERFFEGEKLIREHFSFPPFTKLAKLLFYGENEEKVAKTAHDFHNNLKRLNANLTLYPVIPSGLKKVKDHFRFQFVIASKLQKELLKGVKYVKETSHLPSQVKLFIDINPLSIY